MFTAVKLIGDDYKAGLLPVVRDKVDSLPNLS
jgi:hypothetical protein